MLGMNPLANAVLLRRLFIVKQLFLHAFGHSRGNSAIDKMIAVHNFHNAIEMTLRAVLLEYEIRLEKELNLDFEGLMNAIDQFEDFKKKPLKLPYRSELRKLNTTRNLVQHHAHEPEESSMDEWRVFTHRFLTHAYKEYFSQDFESMSLLDFVNDSRLRKVLAISKQHLSDESWENSLRASKLAFHCSSMSLNTHIPGNGSNMASSAAADLRTGDNNIDTHVRQALDRVYARINAAEAYAVLLATGVNAADYAKYKRTPINVHLGPMGGYQFRNDSGIVEEEAARWTHDFVVSAIMKWQEAGLDPKVSAWFCASCDKFLNQSEVALVAPESGDSA
jgi:hypothetical protein